VNIHHHMIYQVVLIITGH